MRKVIVVATSMLVAGAVWSTALSSAAAEPSPPAVGAPIDAKLATAQQLVVAVGAAGTMHSMMNIMADALSGSLGSAGKDPEMSQFMIKLVKEELDQMVAAYIPKLARIYAETFDEQELKDLLAFYTSPVGQRLVEKQPELSRRGLEAVQPLVAPMQADLIVKMFDHVCQVRHCTPEERKTMESMKLQLLERIKAQSATGRNLT